MSSKDGSGRQAHDEGNSATNLSLRPRAQIQEVRGGLAKVKSGSPSDRFVIALHSPTATGETGLPFYRPEKTRDSEPY